MSAARILNVNDDGAMRYAITRRLEQAGFDVIEAEDATSAMLRVAEMPDLVVLDVRLPDGNGFDICKTLKSNPATSKIAVLLTSSSFTSVPDRVHGLEEGADGYLVQPVEAIELIATVRALLRTKRAEEERAELLARERGARARAEEANRAKDVFLATVSHELRTPLNAMLGWARLLRAGTLDDGATKRAVLAIERNAMAQAQLIEDLLDVSRIASGKLRLEPTVMSLAKVVDAAIEALRPSIDHKTLRVEVAIDPALDRMTGDPSRLQQVVWNLLSNATKFTSEGGRIAVRARADGDHAELTVEDDGKGIGERLLPLVFDPFRQGEEGIARAHGGLGLGLAIAKHIVEGHEGTIVAKSDGDGRGSTFVVRLPRGRGSASPPERPKAKGWDVPPELAGLRVLVVDDEPDARDLARVILERCGCIVDEAACVEDALAVFDRSPPEVLVSDVGLPGADGYFLARAVRAMKDGRGATPAAAITAYAGAEDRRKALDAGFQVHAAKPIEPRDLVAIVAELARARGARAP